MTRAESLIILVHTLSKNEKRIFRIGRKSTDYIVLFDIIEKAGIISSQELKLRYEKKLKNANFNVAVSYLYKILLDSLLTLRANQDNYYGLFNKIMRARILFEKSLFADALDLLAKIKKEAAGYENHIVLLYASRMELEYLLFLNFPDILETELIQKHFQIGELLKNIRKINEQSSLHELLKHRIIYKGNVRSQKQKNSLNDLIFAEMSLASSSKDSFEAKKLHQLFQSNYLIDIGDRKSALQSFRELNLLFENNPQFWANPPFYYVSVLEGILDNLRSMKNYDEIPYFIAQLRKIKHHSAGFQIHVAALVFLYELYPLLDRGNFAAVKKLLDKYGDTVLSKTYQISLLLQTEISLCMALIHIGLRDYKKAQKMLLNEIVRNDSIRTFPLYRTIRLVNLIIHYELGNLEYVRTESRSIKREIAKQEKAYRSERLMISLLNKDKYELINRTHREKLWLKIEPELQDIRKDIFEKQLLKSFDFTAWIESKVCKISLSEALQSRFE
ncbi:MAG: hypothetical protein LBU22_04945 [Dysgonamonadaceae bacterium]|jgi:hypothetical protein|nr:hypothetical protein [Dysgonamonadaceae bacterium]